MSTTAWRACLLLTTLCAAPLAAQPSPAPASDAPAYLRIPLAGRAARARLPAWVDVDHRTDARDVFAYVPPARLGELAALGLAWERLPDPGVNDQALMDLDARAPLGLWDAYPTWPAFVAMLQGYAESHATLARLVDLGPTTRTDRPHRLYAMKLSDHPDAEENEPEVFLTSTMHGDETTGYVTLLHLVDELVNHYDPASSDPYVQRLTRLLDGLEIWIAPLANPDGTYKASDLSVSGAIRYFTFANGSDSYVDPNRNFPDPEYGPHPDGEAWWLETQTMMAFAGAHPFVISANLHGGAEVVNLPWDCWARFHVDNDWLMAWGEQYAGLAQAHGPAGYMTDDPDGDGILGVTNGNAWYEIHGGRQDYTTYWQGGREATIEVSAVKNPAAAQLPVYWEANREALLALLEQALAGVRGLVTDRFGTPLAATVEVVGREADQARIATDPAVGDYHRLLLPGAWSLRFAAAGFQTLTVAGVTAAAPEATRLDVVLLRSGETAPLFADNFETGTCERWSVAIPLLPESSAIRE